jgi:hypothetical protein
MVVLGVIIVLGLLALALVLGAGVPVGVALAAGASGLAVPGIVLWGLIDARWWAGPAAVGLFWAAVLTGVLDVVIGLMQGGLLIPLGAIVAGLVLVIDRPVLTERGVPVAWVLFAIGVVLWAVGILS